MTLPHPHGDASGEIAHNSIKDTGVTPGSTGGKFIGFGEEGTSAVGNRAHWALSENIDYVYQILAADMALPAGASFVTVDQGGGGQLKYQISDDVWVGDGTYPGSAGTSDPEGMLMLFAVLDDQYNELDDGSGNEVRVKLIRDSTETNDVYQGGSPFIANFITNPYVYFHTVDPTTGAEVDASYDIPTGTSVRLLYPSKGNMENLPPDAFSRYKVQSATEVEAGAFLQDGSKKMTGDIDCDENDILNPVNITGASGLDLYVRSQQTLRVLADESISFDDQYTSAEVWLSHPFMGTGIDGRHNSILAAINSQTEVSEILVGNRPLNRTGAMAGNVTGPSMDYPALDLLVDGDIIQVAAGNVNLSAHGTGNIYVYYNPATSTVQGLGNTFFPSTLPAGAIMLWKGSWSGAAWSQEVDLRWPSNRSGTTEAWYVGTGLGADFVDLSTLETVLSGAFTQVPMEDTNKIREIVVVGQAALSSTYWMPSNWRLRGATARGSGTYYENEIVTTSTFTPGSYVIYTASDCEVRDLVIHWGNTSAHQTSPYAGVYLGNNSVAKNLYFGNRGLAFSFSRCLELADSCLAESCMLHYATYQDYGVFFSGDGSYVTNCDLATFGFGAGPATAYVKFDGEDNVVDNCRFDSGSWPNNYFVENGYANNTIQNCHGDLSGVGTKPFVQMTAASATESGINLLNNRLLNGYRLISSTINNGVLNFRLHVHGNIIEGFASTVLDLNNTAVSGDSYSVISENIFDGTVAGYVLYAKDCEWVTFSRNSIVNNGAQGVRFLTGTAGLVDGNYIEGYGTGNAVLLGGRPARLCNNVITDVGAPTSVMVSVSSGDNLIEHNSIYGSALGETGIAVSEQLNMVHGNYFYGCARRFVWVYNSGDGTKIDGNQFVSGIDKAGTVGAVGPWVVAEGAVFLESNLSALLDITVNHNSFTSTTGRAIVTGPRAGTPGVRGLNIVGNQFHGVIGGYLYDSAGPKLDEEGVVRVEYGGGAANGNVINSNVFVDCGNTFASVGVNKKWHAIFCSANYAVINGNSITGIIGTNNIAYNIDEYCWGIWVEGNAVVVGNSVFKVINNQMPCNYYGIEFTASAQGVCASNVVLGSGTATALLGVYTGYRASASASQVNYIGNMHFGSMSNMTAMNSFDLLRASSAGVDMGNFAQTHTSGIGGANILVVGNINDDLVATHTVVGLPTAYTASPVADFNPKI